jgi:hypothetical protein
LTGHGLQLATKLQRSRSRRCPPHRWIPTLPRFAFYPRRDEGIFKWIEALSSVPALDAEDSSTTSGNAVVAAEKNYGISSDAADFAATSNGLKSPVRYVCEIFGAPRFSSFSTQLE